MELLCWSSMMRSRSTHKRCRVRVHLTNQETLSAAKVLNQARRVRECAECPRARGKQLLHRLLLNLCKYIEPQPAHISDQDCPLSDLSPYAKVVLVPFILFVPFRKKKTPNSSTSEAGGREWKKHVPVHQKSPTLLCSFNKNLFKKNTHTLYASGLTFLQPSHLHSFFISV